MDRQDRLESVVQFQDLVEYSPLDHPVACALFALSSALAPAPPDRDVGLCQAQCASAAQRAGGGEKRLNRRTAGLWSAATRRRFNYWPTCRPASLRPADELPVSGC